MSTAEIVAWNTGVALFQGGMAPTTFLLMPTRTLAGRLSPEELLSRVRLGNDTWARWVRRGYDDAVACHA